MRVAVIGAAPATSTPGLLRDCWRPSPKRKGQIHGWKRALLEGAPGVYRPAPPKAEDLELMALMDRQYLKTPFYAKPVAGRLNNPLYDSQLPVLIRPQVVRISRGQLLL